MMRWIWTLLAMLTAGGAGIALTLMPQPKPLPVLVGGRVIEARDGSKRFGWPGVYFEARFRGTGVTVAADPGEDQLSLVIDGQEQVVLTKTSPPRVTIDGLAPGEHIVRLEKLTESQHGSDGFTGFWATDGGTPLKPQPKARRIEFIGDSHTVGYGNTSPRRDCARGEVHDTTNTQLAFGPLLAKRLGADYRVNAFSGHGIVRNYGGNGPGDSMPKRYGRAIPGDEGAADDKGWQPDWVVIDLGSNDFSTPLHAGEAWADAAALHADYRATYVGFVRMLLGKYPKARVLLVRYKLFDADVEAVAAAVADGRVATVKVEPTELTGCDWHPSLKDDRDMADALERAIRGL
jgi:lysophospholipase L1-like esterase